MDTGQKMIHLKYAYYYLASNYEKMYQKQRGYTYEKNIRIYKITYSSFNKI